MSPRDEAPVILELDRVTMAYVSAGGTMLALDDVSLGIREGSFLTLIGPSGCGKSTILNLLAGYLTPAQGRVLMQGRPIEGPSAERVVVHQQSSALLPWLNVEENVGIGLAAKGIPRARRREIVAHYLDLVSLTGFGGHAIYQLSGGMQQRVALARALAVDSPVVLLDEPLGAIDALQREVMQDLLLKTWDKAKKTFVLITHGVDEAVYLGTEIAIMSPRPGRIIHQRPLDFGTKALRSSKKDACSTPEFSEAHYDILSKLVKTT